MAFTAILRRSASTLSPFASRLVRSGAPRNYHSALFTVLHKSSTLYPREPSTVPFLHSYSTAIDTKKASSTESILQVLDSEINLALETDDHDRAEEVPEGFPFKIEDSPGQQTVTLTREYEGELVKIDVRMPDLVTGEDNDVTDDNDDAERAIQSTLPLTVTVTKKSGVSLVFDCVASPDEISIDDMSVKNPENSEDQIAYEGPNFHDLDENLRNAFHKYLEIRGVKPSTTNFLHEYMINKDSREYVGWLKNLKNFIDA